MSRYGNGFIGILDGVDLTQQFCHWDPNRPPAGPPLLRRQEDSPMCAVPSPTPSALSTSSSTEDPAPTRIPLDDPDLTQTVTYHDEADFTDLKDINKNIVILYADEACKRWTGYPYGTSSTETV